MRQREEETHSPTDDGRAGEHEATGPLICGPVFALQRMIHGQEMKNDSRRVEAGRNVALLDIIDQQIGHQPHVNRKAADAEFESPCGYLAFGSLLRLRVELIKSVVR